MTGDISAIGVELINSYMHPAIGVCAFVGAVLYLLVQHKSEAANPGAGTAVSFTGFIDWAVMCGAIPVCLAFMASLLMPKLLSALQSYSVVPALSGAYYMHHVIWKKILPKLREYFASRE